VSDIVHAHSDTTLKIVAICQTVSFCNQTIFQAGNNSEHNIETVFSLCAAAYVHARAFSSVSLKFHKTHMPCRSHRGTSFGSVETSLTTQRATCIPLVLTILTVFVSVLKNSFFIRSMCQLRRAVNEERYHARNNKRGNALSVSEKCKFLRAC